MSTCMKQLFFLDFTIFYLFIFAWEFSLLVEVSQYWKERKLHRKASFSQYTDLLNGSFGCLSPSFPSWGATHVRSWSAPLLVFSIHFHLLLSFCLWLHAISKIHLTCTNSSYVSMHAPTYVHNMNILGSINMG